MTDKGSDHKNIEGLLSKDAFLKWRCLISLAHADKKIQPIEREFFITKFKELEKEGITEHEMDIIKDDFQTPKKTGPLFQDIDDLHEKLHVIVLGYKLLWCDEEFDLRERKRFQFLVKQVAETYKMDRFFIEDMCRNDNIKSIQDIKECIESSDNPFHQPNSSSSDT